MSIIKSKISNAVIASFVRYEDVSGYRNDLSDDTEFIQASARKLKRGTKVQAHKHLKNNRTSDLTQEVWIVIKGSILANFYDLDSSFLTQEKFSDGDMVVFFRGGHSLEVVDEDTVFYEIKNGPYLGVDKDKENITERII